MKKLALFISFIVIIFILFLVFTNNSRNYSVTYKIDNYDIEEVYHKDEKYYSFIISNEDKRFNFVYESDYRSDRKIVENLDVINNDNIFCIKPEVLKMNFNYVCYTDKYVDEYVAGINDNEESKIIGTVSNIEVYNKDNTYYIWNGKGFTDILNDNKYNFLKKESYDNSLSFQGEDYIIVADYDQTREYNKFYIFDYNKKKIEEWDIKYNINTDSYFMGNVEGNLYLFDRKNSIQYKLDIKNKKIDKISNKENGEYYNKEWKKISLNELKYYDKTMSDDNLYDYLLINNKLYLNIDNSENNILVSDKDIDTIITVNNNKVYYMVDESIYSYKYGEGEKLLLINFEWNFSYKNKIFIFN